ncbi:alpha-glucan family phosphorylase [Leptolyngbya sp. 15MV]|nr:alpha-glucan family phosphorylase [Leptolyngbya sp. 15MV]
MGPNHRFDAPRIAYFSMEIGLQSSIPTYSGGLGVLAGDTIKAAADIGVPMIGVTLLQRKGYLRQRLDESGWQIEEVPVWRVEDYMHELPERVTVQLEGRTVAVRAWRRDVHGATGHSVPVLYLDTDLEGNDHPDRALTGQLYGGDNRYRLKQETVLGPGGFRMLRALGLGTIEVYHLNEGHAALLAGELLRQVLMSTGKTHVDAEAVELVRRRCVFTTHTPVPAGHDRFPLAVAREVLGHHPALEASGLFDRDGDLHMTIAALNLSRFVNGVSRKHGEVSRAMFPGRDIRSITNGVHHNTWVAPEMAALFDRHFEHWRAHPSEMRGMLRVPEIEVWDAHHAAKVRLLDAAQRLGAPPMDPGAFTIGFARRATAYKRADMLLSDPHRLRAIAQKHGPIQLLFAGKAHPRDQHGKEIIQNSPRAAGTRRRMPCCE